MPVSSWGNFKPIILYLVISRRFPIVSFRHTSILSIFILVIFQLDAQNLFSNKFISCLYVFQAPYAHHQEVKIVLYSLWYLYTYKWLYRARVNL